MTADNDPREHYAHFHPRTGDRLFDTVTDARPSMRAVVRASSQAREEYARSALYSCTITTLLLVGITIALWFRSASYSTESIVALLLFIPAGSLYLLGRIPGDQIRYWVVSRVVRWSRVSLIPPTAAALLISVGDRMAAGPGGPVEHLLQFNRSAPLHQSGAAWLWLVFLLASFAISALALADRNQHRRGFRFDTPIGATITVHPEAPPSGGRRPVDPTFAEVDHTVVHHLASVALGNRASPGRRFQVRVRLDDDRPGVLQRIITEIERLPERLAAELAAAVEEAVADGGGLDAALEPQGPARALLASIMRGLGSVGDLLSDGTVAPDGSVAFDRVTVESSVALSVATTGLIVAHFTYLDSGPGGRVALVGEKARELLSAIDGSGRTEVEVVELAETERTVGAAAGDWQHIDAVFEIPPGRNPLPALLVGLLDLGSPSSVPSGSLGAHRAAGPRISYVHCPIAPRAADGATATTAPRLFVKVGLEVERGLPLVTMSALRWDLCLLADRVGCQLAFDQRRRFPDPPGEGRSFDWGGRNGQPMILSYFGDDPDAGLRSLLQAPVGPGGMVSAGGDAPLPRSLRIEGVTLLSAGGYGCAALRVWGDELLDPATRPDWPPAWRVHRSGTEANYAPTASGPGGSGGSGGPDGPAPLWSMLWLRWHLVADDEHGLGRLLRLVDAWHRRETPSRAAVRLMNLEYLTNRAGADGSAAGKAKFRYATDSGGGPGGRGARRCSGRWRRSCAMAWPTSWATTSASWWWSRASRPAPWPTRPTGGPEAGAQRQGSAADGQQQTVSSRRREGGARRGRRPPGARGARRWWPPSARRPGT